RRVKCPGCGSTFDAAAAAPATAPPPEAVAPTSPPAPPQPAPHLSLEHERPALRPREEEPRPRKPADDRPPRLEPCPACGEMIRRDAPRCRFCGEVLEGADDEDDYDDDYEDRRGIRRDAEPHRGGLILTFGIISIIAPFTYCLA